MSLKQVSYTTLYMYTCIYLSSNCDSGVLYLPCQNDKIVNWGNQVDSQVIDLHEGIGDHYQLCL